MYSKSGYNLDSINVFKIWIQFINVSKIWIQSRFYKCIQNLDTIYQCIKNLNTIWIALITSEHMFITVYMFTGGGGG
jgi:hypothetical protein